MTSSIRMPSSCFWLILERCCAIGFKKGNKEKNKRKAEQLKKRKEEKAQQASEPAHEPAGDLDKRLRPDDSMQQHLDRSRIDDDAPHEELAAHQHSALGLPANPSNDSFQMPM